MLIPLPTALHLAALLSSLFPQPQQAARATDELQARRDALSRASAAWRAARGDAWRVQPDDQGAFAEMIWGGRAAADLEPAREEDWEALARDFVAATAGLHGVRPSSLVHDRSLFLPLGLAGGTDKMTVRFRQVVDGVPVVGGALNVLMDAASGALLAVQSRAVAGLDADLELEPALSAQSALEHGKRLFVERIGGEPAPLRAPELVLLPREVAGARSARLSWQMELRFDLEQAVPEVWRYWIDAASGALLESESLVHHLDVGGTVRSNTTAGTLPDGGGGATQARIQPYIQVTSSAGVSKADVDGNFNFQGVNGPLDCTFTFVGPFALVTNAAGSEYSLSLSLTGTGNQVLMNPSPSQALTAQSNAYTEITLLRNWIRGVIPTDFTADFQALANCNIASTCNAYFDGGSVNFFSSGGGCVNTAYSTVVAHEMGHWLNVLYNTGNGSDGMGEGNADVFAMYMYDTPIVGENFCGSGCNIRSGTTNVQFCGDCCPGCQGGVHASGQVWMGAAWKVRRNLNNVHGNSAGDAIANLLFLSWMNAFDQTQIRSIIEAQWLTLDDDDGFIQNGTPNFQAIDSAFREQGFPGVTLNPCFGGTYCVAAPNSTGAGASIGFTGSLSVGANDTQLLVSGAPALVPGIFFYGPNQTQVPFGNGFRCVGGGIFRLPILTVGAGGTLSYALDVNAPPQPAGQILDGSTWRFQFWYRDPAGGGANFNLSDALSLTFCN